MEFQQTAEKIVQESLDVDEPLAKRSRMLNEKDVRPINMSFDQITKNPGLQHISDDVFKLLDKKSLMNCRLVNHSWNNVMCKPNFWFKKLKQDEEDFFKGFDEEESDDEEEGVDFLDSLKKLHQELGNDLQHEFILVLMSIYKIPLYIPKSHNFRRRPNCLLEIVMDLKRMGKCHELMKFILEYVDPFTPVFISSGDLSEELPTNFPLSVLSIHLAAFYGFVELVEKLIKKYDSPMVRTEQYLTPMHFAASNGHSNVVEFLAPLTDMPNMMGIHGVTPILLAAEFGHLNVIELLVPLTDTPNAPDNAGATPITIASSNGHKKIIEILAPLVHNPNAPDGDGITPIHYAAEKGHLEILKFLVNFTDSPNTIQDNDGNTPLHDAAKSGHLDVVKFLVPLWENPNHQNNNGITPIDVARFQKHENIVHFLENYCKKN